MSKLRSIKRLLIVIFGAGLATSCTSTLKVAVEPITISAKLDADVHVRLDRTARGVPREME